MTNRDVITEYASCNFAIEQIMQFLLIEYREKSKIDPRLNLVGFVRDFLKEDTCVDIDLVEKSKMESLEEKVVVSI